MKRFLVGLLLLGACVAPVDDSDDRASGELGLGALSEGDSKSDGAWGAATTCKELLDLPVLVAPKIVISIDGLTLHLFDTATGYDKVFPVGVGAIDKDAGSSTFGESLSYWPVERYGQDFTIKPSGVTACRIWWTDKATGETLPVFAGLPFMRWNGAYAIHGPIDNYRAANGGSLRRGYVSHGCVRMESADVLEVYARTKGKDVPVHVQREPERLPSGVRTDAPAKWVGSECAVDADCNFEGGFCHSNSYGGRSFCSVRCTQFCTDKAGMPATFCVADPDAAGQGMCVNKVTDVNYGCRPYDEQAPKTLARFGQPSVTASVCVPGSGGWVGEHCTSNADCKNGTTCNQATASTTESIGMCSVPCVRYCTDMPGYADTLCVADASMGNTPACVRQCTPSTNAPECGEGFSCVSRSRAGEPSMVRNVCLPQ